MPREGSKEVLMRRIASLLGLLLLVVPPALAQTPLGTTFTYQGQLNDAGSPANGPYDFEFRLFDSAAATTQVGPTVTVGDVVVTGGLFTVTLDFGPSVFAGDKRWLEIRVRPGASGGGYTVLSPLQELTASPNAVFSSTASSTPWSGLTGVPAGFADGIDNDSGGTITGVTAGTGLSGGGVTGTVTLSANFAGSGSAGTLSHSDHDHFGQTWTGAAADGLLIQNSDPAGIGVFGEATATTGVNTGVYARSFSTAGRGVVGVATAPTGTTYAIYGASASSSGYGTVGETTATTGVNYGVYGKSASSSGYGVYGLAYATTGANRGVYGESDSTAGIGVYGVAAATTGANTGVYGRSDSTAGRGVLGLATAPTGTTYAVYGANASSNGYGIFGVATATTGTTYAVYGQSASTAGLGVYGDAPATTGATSGVFGQSASSSGYGTVGQATATTGTNYGVFGRTFSPTGYAGYFLGNVHVQGTLSKTAGSFKIDHPLDPENKYLYHSFVESPDMMNIYNGNVTTDASGYATVELPDWFGALNKDFRYQLTVIGQFAQAIVAEEIADNRFTIRTSLPGVKVSWQVTGIRQDPYAEKHRIPVEQDKPEAERGKYLHPAVYGQPEEKGVDYEHRPKAPPTVDSREEQAADAEAAR